MAAVNSDIIFSIETSNPEHLKSQLDICLRPASSLILCHKCGKVSDFIFYFVQKTCEDPRLET